MTVTSDFAVLMNEDLTEYDVIVPVWSCGIKSEYYLDPLLRAVQGGVGLATFHGGINWFEDEKYYQMLGALYLFDSSDEEFTVNIVDKEHPIAADLTDFNVVSEQYRLRSDRPRRLGSRRPGALERRLSRPLAELGPAGAADRERGRLDLVRRRDRLLGCRQRRELGGRLERERRCRDAGARARERELRDSGERLGRSD